MRISAACSDAVWRGSYFRATMLSAYSWVPFFDIESMLTKFDTYRYENRGSTLRDRVKKKECVGQNLDP